MRGWRRFKAQLAYKREKRKKKKSKSDHPEFSGFCLLAVSALGLYCSLWPKHSGVAGAITSHWLMRSIGRSSFLLWGLLAFRGIKLLLNKEDRQPWRFLLVDGLLIVSVCSLLSSFALLFGGPNPGGVTGRALFAVLEQLFGTYGGFFVSLVTVGAFALWRAGRGPRDVIQFVTGALARDWAEWQTARNEDRVKTTIEAPKKKPLPKVLPPTSAEKPESERPELSPALAGAEKPIVRMKPEPPVVKIPPMSPPQRQPPFTVLDPAPFATAPDAGTASLSDTPPPQKPYKLPSIDMLTPAERATHVTKEEDLLASAKHLEKTLSEFGVEGKVVEIHPGPIITRFDYTPAPGIKVQTVASLNNDIALAMKAMSVRIVAPIPGKSAVGIELPNPHRVVVRLREIFESTQFSGHRSKIALGLGKDAEGLPVIGDLATMPHLLIAGSTGAGKSVCIHALIMSLLMRATPQEVKLLMIDPKRLELPLYNGIPYLFDPNQNADNCRVITDAKEAAKALEGMVKVMEHRFKKFAAVMARDITDYNEKMAAQNLPPEAFIVIIIDELADLMAVAAKEVEGSIQRLTQMARAVGIHMILATQRPSVDVITGVIKANLPARIAFRVASQTDSRVILDSIGAESLLGQGDMLYLPPGAPKPERLQCGLVSNKDVQIMTDFAREQGIPAYERLLVPITKGSGGDPDDAGSQEELDDLQQALMLVLERKRVSQDLLKAHFGSSARATDLLSILEVKGFIEKPEGTNRWTIYFERIDAYLGQLRNQSTQVS